VSIFFHMGVGSSGGGEPFSLLAGGRSPLGHARWSDPGGGGGGEIFSCLDRGGNLSSDALVPTSLLIYAFPLGWAFVCLYCSREPFNAVRVRSIIDHRSPKMHSSPLAISLVLLFLKVFFCCD
jgi:hypothetical protein